MEDFEDDTPLEERINQTEQFIKQGVMKGIAHNKPFEYMANLSITGYNNYNVDDGESFYYGVDRALDYYNTFKDEKPTAVFDSLVHGSRCILRYIYHRASLNDNE